MIYKILRYFMQKIIAWKKYLSGLNSRRKSDLENYRTLKEIIILCYEVKEIAELGVEEEQYLFQNCQFSREYSRFRELIKTLQQSGKLKSAASSWDELYKSVEQIESLYEVSLATKDIVEAMRFTFRPGIRKSILKKHMEVCRMVDNVISVIEGKIL